jgi:hypothetical protein
MNTRLHQLCRQALEQARVNACAKNKTDRPQNNTVWNEFPEVFAELIVEECMDQVWYTREDGINGNISQVIKDRIKEHFGVEEPPVDNVDRILRTVRTRG